MVGHKKQFWLVEWLSLIENPMCLLWLHPWSGPRIPYSWFWNTRSTLIVTTAWCCVHLPSQQFIFPGHLIRSQPFIVISHLKACYFKGVPPKEVLVSFSDLMIPAFVARSSSMNNHWTMSFWIKRHGCCVKPPTVRAVFWPIPGLISCTGVTRRWHDRCWDQKLWEQG